MKLCRSLRWKGLRGLSFPDRDTVVRAMQLNDADFSCLRTCQAWGPDDDIAVPEVCQPGRGCFELSPRDPDAVHSLV
jgi:hypothetical protein